MYKKIGKRLLDILLSLLALVILSPLFLVLSLIKKRIGKNKRIFQILKYRTMRIDAPKDCPTHLLRDANSYITPKGKILRKISLDELPQIINILKGEMSIIGPRPTLWNQYDLISERDKYSANDILPGLTGWAQINGRDELEISLKAKLDGEYVIKLSLRFDILCFFKTISSILKHEGIVEGTGDK